MGPGSLMAAKGSWDHGAVEYTNTLPHYQGRALGAVSQGPYPKTPEEPATAAKKYIIWGWKTTSHTQMTDNMGYSDCPKLPDHSWQERDPWYDWDRPDLRLNWDEPMYWNLDMYIGSLVDTSPMPVS